MARPPRSCFVYKPLHKYRYLPRPNARPSDFDYETSGSTPDDFQEKLETAPKLWVAWLYRKPVQETRNLRRITEELFGEKPKLLDMKVFKNTPYWNRQLWQIKHLIEVKAIYFPHGEPTEADIPYVRLLPTGECLVHKQIDGEDQLAEVEQDNGRSLQRLINRQLMLKWKEFDEILEDSPWSPPDRSRF
uniref:39S ribosomal protein L30, mitochondrial n=1 Tax=Trichuris muris TaxID=70415 RepID=A0A5S6QIZ1_TRIMR